MRCRSTCERARSLSSKSRNRIRVDQSSGVDIDHCCVVAVDGNDDESVDQRADVYAIGAQLMWFAAVSEHSGIWFNRRDEHSPVQLATGWRGYRSAISETMRPVRDHRTERSGAAGRPTCHDFPLPSGAAVVRTCHCEG